MKYQLISSQSDLQHFCAQAGKAQAIALDTEFVRTRTLYPQLGLIQAYDGVSLVLIDALAVDDLTPFAELLTNTDIVKVLHSCSEDIETFWHSLQVIPKPVFDTQLAACMLNKGASLGYANLVELLLQIKLDKGESRTDWLARPLSEKQCEYAANDVLYLWEIYPQLRDQIAQLERTDWLYNEIELLALKKQRYIPSEMAYLLVKNNWQLRDRSLLILKLLAKWRIEQARQRDMAVNFVLREQNMVSIAKMQPNNKGALFAISGVTPKEARLHGDFILETVAKAQNAQSFPPPVPRITHFSQYKQKSQAIRAQCLQLAEQLNLPPEILGSKKQINQLLKWLWLEIDETKAQQLVPDLLFGWRKILLQASIDEIMEIDTATMLDNQCSL